MYQQQCIKIPTEAMYCNHIEDEYFVLCPCTESREPAEFFNDTNIKALLLLF